jgi:mono/diheme cytochrome c family protein
MTDLRSLPYVVMIAALTLGPIAPAFPQAESAAAASAGDASDAATVVSQVCAGACHPADRYRTARKTPEEWRKVILQMVAHGAQLFPEDIDAVTKYMSDRFGRASVPGGRQP